MSDEHDRALALIDRASQALAEARTVPDVKRLLGIAAAAETYARRVKASKVAIDYAVEIRVRAERRLGECLAAEPMATRGRGRSKSGEPHFEVVADDRKRRPPTLGERGLSKDLSARAQKLAALPEPVFERAVAEAKAAGDISLRRVLAEEKREARRVDHNDATAKATKAVTKAARRDLSSVCDLRVCSCCDLLAASPRPDVVITDPPYPSEFLPVYSDLGAACAQAGVPLVAVMVGQSYLPEVLRRLCEHLAYRWTLAYLTPGGQAVQQWAAKVNTSWKPVLLFGEAGAWFGDVARSKPNDNDKRFHGWGQSESGMLDLVERLSKPGDLVCDPFLGGGTTAVVSLALGRRFVGGDVDADAVETARKRAAACVR